jgi:hypothetical protein
VSQWAVDPCVPWGNGSMCPSGQWIGVSLGAVDPCVPRLNGQRPHADYSIFALSVPFEFTLSDELV